MEDFEGCRAAFHFDGALAALEHAEVYVVGYAAHGVEGEEVDPGCHVDGRADTFIQCLDEVIDGALDPGFVVGES